jgi:hypothetical protein
MTWGHAAYHEYRVISRSAFGRLATGFPCDFHVRLNELSRYGFKGAPKSRDIVRTIFSAITDAYGRLRATPLPQRGTKSVHVKAAKCRAQPNAWIIRSFIFRAPFDILSAYHHGHTSLWVELHLWLAVLWFIPNKKPRQRRYPCSICQTTYHQPSAEYPDPCTKCSE